jgi:TP901-1 family phage major tail protein
MATTGIINGTDLLVYVGGTAITHSTSASISFSMETRDASTKDSAGYRAILEGQRSWTIEAEGMTAMDAANGYEELFAAWVARTALTIKFATADAADQFYQGTGYCTSLSVDSGVEDSSTFSASFEMTGTVTTS